MLTLNKHGSVEVIRVGIGSDVIAEEKALRMYYIKCLQLLEPAEDFKTISNLGALYTG